MQQTAYKTYAYLIPSPNTRLITQNAREDLAKSDFSVRCHFPTRVRGTAKGKKRAVAAEEDPQLQDTATNSGARPSPPTKRKREVEDDPEDDASVIEISSESEPLEVDSSPPSRGENILGSSIRRGWEPNDLEVLSDSGGGGDAAWMRSFRQKPRQRRRTQSPGTMADLSDF